MVFGANKELTNKHLKVSEALLSMQVIVYCCPIIKACCVCQFCKIERQFLDQEICHVYFMQHLAAMYNIVYSN